MDRQKKINELKRLADELEYFDMQGFVMPGIAAYAISFSKEDDGRYVLLADTDDDGETELDDLSDEDIDALYDELVP